MESSAGMKKLVPRVLSSSIITPLTNSAGNPTSARMEATKMPQTVSGMRISVMPSQRACSTVVT
ncbi:hypothetical protein D3C73_1667840 [compost metagenome]